MPTSALDVVDPDLMGSALHPVGERLQRRVSGWRRGRHGSLYRVLSAANRSSRGRFERFGSDVQRIAVEDHHVARFGFECHRRVARQDLFYRPGSAPVCWPILVWSIRPIPLDRSIKVSGTAAVGMSGYSQPLAYQWP